ncbi:hypothetical protein MNBD_ALPHA09-1337 [hydrothermal vent metagenome]|uniref:TNase-like domain-containing protein n=1 Tax=hydrothermal vent metagenome TaxID=652676 RepID=A0A3B0T603_9ZZZZ
MKRGTKFFLLALVSVLTMGLSPPDFSRKDMIFGPPKIVDGDTVEIGGKRIDFFGIDAPEIGQNCRIFDLDWPCGDRAVVWLARFIGEGDVRCLPMAGRNDRAGDLKAMCFNDETLNLNAAMIGEGMAVVNLKDGDWFEVADTTARINRRGLWAGKFVNPADWRRGRRMAPAGNRTIKRLKP